MFKVEEKKPNVNIEKVKPGEVTVIKKAGKVCFSII